MMGLDISYASKFTLRYDIPEGAVEDHYSEGVTWLYPNDDFPDHFEGLPLGTAIQSEEKHFSAGSYGGYNQWRRLLCQEMNEVEPETIWRTPDQFKGQPFVELIHFSDCEGVIGPVASSKLALDFEAHRHRISDWDKWDQDLYDNFSAAFKAASGGGYVEFH